MKLIILLFVSFNFSLFAQESSKSARTVRINYASKAELERDLLRLTSKDVLVSIFDEIETASFTLQFINDYDFKDPNIDPLEKNDDIGYTHGYKMEVQKNLAAQGFDAFYLTISFESQLHTNSDRPEEFQQDYRDIIYLNERGFYQADVYFKEQNMIEIIAGKIKANDAYFWSAGVGFVELNADDSDRPFLFSSIEHQRWLHQTVNDVKGATIREYNYLPNEEGSESGIHITGEFGKDITLYTNDNHRSFIRPTTSTRISTLSGASYVGGNIEIGHEYLSTKNSFIPAMRFTTNYDYKKYSDGSKQRSYGFQITTEGEHFGLTIKHTRPLDDDPAYLNPLPQSFVDRDTLIPQEDPMTWFILKGKL